MLLQTVGANSEGEPIASAQAPVGVRVSACLDGFRSLMTSGAVEARRVELLERAIHPEDLSDAVDALRCALAEIDGADWRATVGARGRRVAALRDEIQTLIIEIQQLLLKSQQDVMRGVHLALQRLESAETRKHLIELAAIEVCRSCGVDRCCIFSVDGASMQVASVCFAGDDAFQEEWEAYARAHPVELNFQDKEVQAMRRKMPILVNDTGHLDGMQELISLGRASSYVAAPIITQGSVSGMIHADRYFAGRRVDPLVRDALGAFSAGLGYALERNRLIEGTQAHLRQVRSMFAEIEDSLEVTLGDGVMPIRGLAGPPAAPATATAMPSTGLVPTSRIMELLTRRELEVMELMARGASNHDIAARLVISEGTVKSHVKHILRKLHATNRAQAVSAYMRIRAVQHA